MEEFYYGNATGIVTTLTTITGAMGLLGLLLALVGLYGSRRVRSRATDPGDWDSHGRRRPVVFGASYGPPSWTRAVGRRVWFWA